MIPSKPPFLSPLHVLLCAMVLTFCMAMPGAGQAPSPSDPGNVSLEALAPELSFLDWAEGVMGDDETATPTEQLRTFEGLTLRNCLELALQQNFGLIISKRGLLSSQSSYREARAEFTPFLTINGEAGIGKDRQRVEEELVETKRKHITGGAEVRQNIATGGSVRIGANTGRTGVLESTYDTDASIQFEQPLLRGGGIRRGLASLRKSHLSLLETEIQDALEERDIALQVIQQYFDILSSKRELQVSLDAVAEKERFYEATIIRFRLDEIAESEISRAEIQLLQERNDVVTRRRSYQESLEGLLVLLGLPLETPISVSDPTESLLEMSNAALPELEECVTEAMSNRLELVESDLEVRQQKINLDIAKNEILPNLDFSAGYNADDSGINFGESRHVRDNTSWDTVLTFSIPLPNTGKREALFRSRLSLENSETRRLSQERDVIRDVMQAYRRVKASESSLLILKRTVEQAQKSLDQETARFENGLSTSLEVRNAQDDLFETQTRYFSELLNYQSNIARLYKSMGRNLF
ncbi:MAG TPA: TolC family protein [Candidatus Sumerlaeota bacterium]|nr:TolC family protein [Candidatus Sumerlaeota bacterium]